MDGTRPNKAAVDESAQSRHSRAPGRAVEWSARVAGGFPTLGGGLRVEGAALRASSCSEHEAVA
jgi:hypothetical protein